MKDELRFRPDLYAGSAENYERYRPNYPPQLLARLVEEAGVSSHGRLLDLACGTGQVTFGLCEHFEQVWAVDQEADMVRVGRSKAKERGIEHIKWVFCAAEDLMAPAGSFELIASGNAFHRLPRQLIAAKAFEWLRPGSYLALLWGGSPWREDRDWQRVLAATCDDWVDAVGARDRVPAGWQEVRAEKPDLEVLREAGFDRLERFSVPVTLDWTFTNLVGYVYSTSVLPRALLGDKGHEFEDDLRRRLAEVAEDGPYRQETEFAFEIGRRP
jgi:SAM-dependent methyltransferase